MNTVTVQDLVAIASANKVLEDNGHMLRFVLNEHGTIVDLVFDTVEFTHKAFVCWVDDNLVDELNKTIDALFAQTREYSRTYHNVNTVGGDFVARDKVVNSNVKFARIA